MYYTYCKHQAVIGGYSECLKGHDDCTGECKDFIEEEEDYDPYYDEHCKSKWNEPKHRCYEGIPCKDVKCKKHLDEYEWRQYWKKFNIEWHIKWLGYNWCLEHGLIDDDYKIEKEG